MCHVSVNSQLFTLGLFLKIDIYLQFVKSFFDFIIKFRVIQVSPYPRLSRSQRPRIVVTLLYITFCFKFGNFGGELAVLLLILGGGQKIVFTIFYLS